MPLLIWSEEYSVKIREIDSQHKKLVDLINTLYEIMLDNKDGEQIESILNNLVNYAAYHFSFEENLFGKYGYPETVTHIAKHNEFINRLKKFIICFQNGEEILLAELMEFLQHWLVDHICSSDKKYSPFFNEKGIS